MKTKDKTVEYEVQTLNSVLGWETYDVGLKDLPSAKKKVKWLKMEWKHFGFRYRIVKVTRKVVK